MTARMRRGSTRPAVRPATVLMAAWMEAMSALSSLYWNAGRLSAQSAAKDDHDAEEGKFAAGPE